MNIRCRSTVWIIFSFWSVTHSLAQENSVSNGSAVGVMLASPLIPFTAGTTKSNLPALISSKSEYHISYGWDQRWRNEEWNNIFDYNEGLDDERIQNSFRQRFWLNAPSSSDSFVLYVRVLNQFVKQEKNGSLSSVQRKINSDEWIFDNLYVDFNRTFIKNLKARIGRQDLSFGEGFLFMDGSAGDGPRTNYMNAFQLTYTKEKATFDLLGVLDPRQDRLLPKLHNQHKYLNEWDEQGLGLYYRDRKRKDIDWDVYYFLKKETRDYRAQTNAQFQPDRHISTLGTRIIKRFPDGLEATGELTYQWGFQRANLTHSRPEEDIHAWGMNVYAKKIFELKFMPYLQGGYLGLSGDDGKTTRTNEGFDPLFSRWPKWSGGYVWSFHNEKGDAYWTNLNAPNVEAGFNPVRPVTLKVVSYFMWAFHPYTLASNTAIFSTGTYRGTVPEILALYKFNDKLSGEFRYEVIEPGSFYISRAKGQYFRFEVNYCWKKVWGLGSQQ